MSVSVAITVADLELALPAELCLGCGGRKRIGPAICDSCLAMQTLYLRDWLTQRQGEELLEAVRRALQHLVDLRPMRHRHWTYTSLDELEAAGFRYSDRGQCRSLRCLQQIAWVRTPAGGRMPLDANTYRPHAEVCLDPVGVVLGRIRYLQTPAGRRQQRAKAKAAKARA